MPKWIQIQVVSDDEEPAAPASDTAPATSSGGLAKWLAIGSGLALVGVVAFAGWYFGLRGGDQPTTAAGAAVPMPAGQLQNQAVPANQPQSQTGATSDTGAAATTADLTLSAEAKRRLSSDKRVAVINGEPITEAKLEREVGIIRVLYPLMKDTPVGNDPQTLERMRADLLSGVVEEQLVAQKAREAGITVDEAELDARVDRLLSSVGLAEEALADRLSMVDVSMDNLRASLRATMLAERFVAENPPPEGVSAQSDYAAWVEHLQEEGDVQILVDGEAAKIAKVGQPAPDFTLRSPDGDSMSLSDFAGQPVLINFWATWCPPCEFEMPLLEQTYQDLKDEGFVVLGVDVQEGPEEVKAYAQEKGLSFPIVLDRAGSVSNTYRVSGLPTTVFVDENGIVTDVHRGALIESSLQGYLESLMPQQIDNG